VWTRLQQSYLRAQGLSQLAIARELGGLAQCCRQSTGFERSARVQAQETTGYHNLAPFGEQIKEMLFDEKFRWGRILRELRKLGFGRNPFQGGMGFSTFRTCTARKTCGERV